MITKDQFIRAREYFGLSQKEFGEKLDLSREYVGLIERGQKSISKGVSAIVELLLLKENKVINYEDVEHLLITKMETPLDELTERGVVSEIEENANLALLEARAENIEVVTETTLRVMQLVLEAVSKKSSEQISEQVDNISAEVLKEVVGRRMRPGGIIVDNS